MTIFGNYTETGAGPVGREIEQLLILDDFAVYPEITNESNIDVTLEWLKVADAVLMLGLLEGNMFADRVAAMTSLWGIPTFYTVETLRRWGIGEGKDV
jgi:hypothetical protein